VERKCAEKTATAASGKKMDQQCSREDVVGAVEAAAGAGAQGVATPAGAAPHQGGRGVHWYKFLVATSWCWFTIGPHWVHLLIYRQP